MTDDEIFQLTDDHEFETLPGYRRKENGSDIWEPACCFRRPYMFPHPQYCGFAERHHRMRMIHGPVLVLKEHA